MKHIRVKFGAAIFCVSIFLVGCFGFVPFQPNPDQDEMWWAVGKSKIEVQKAMLECGYPNLSSIRGNDPRYPSINEIASTFQCMKNSGFVYGKEGYNLCNGFRELPACQPDAVIPGRDPSLRIKGSFCKSHANLDACKP